jgi:tRNA wybutosine-synthesizing protein 1
MANVPWHEEVVKFVRLLCERLPQFDVACEHEHSNCLLLANTKVKKTSLKITFRLYETLFLVPC